jgi:hypothetical protein
VLPPLHVSLQKPNLMPGPLHLLSDIAEQYHLVSDPLHIFFDGTGTKSQRQKARSRWGLFCKYLLYFPFRNSPFHQPVGHSAGLCVCATCLCCFVPVALVNYIFPFVKLLSFLSVEAFVFFSLGQLDVDVLTRNE